MGMGRGRGAWGVGLGVMVTLPSPNPPPCTLDPCRPLLPAPSTHVTGSQVAWLPLPFCLDPLLLRWFDEHYEIWCEITCILHPASCILHPAS